MMQRWWKKNWVVLLAALAASLLFCYPYLIRDFLGIEHDTFFHVSRIQGLAEAISRGDWLPAIYPYKNNSFGYASPLFYSDFFLIIPALLYNAGLNLAACYKLVIFACTFFSFLTMASLARRVSGRQSAAVLAGTAYLFANYRITDVYVRGALGEVMAMIFLPVVLSGIYEILDQRRAEQWPLLAFGLSGLVLCHNLTFLFGIVMILLLFLSYLKQCRRDLFLALCKAALSAFLLSAFFTLPMLEQLRSQQFYLNYYATSSDLGSQAMALWQYFANTTVFGLGGNTYARSQTMLENIGWFLTFAPLLFLVLKPKQIKGHAFLLRCLGFGYLFLILPSRLFPWADMAVFRVIQFPWRLMTIALVFLCLPASAALSALPLKNKSLAPAVMTAVLLTEGIWHLYPATKRTFGLTSQTTYQDIITGKLIDPYYSAFYVRVECAGGDYLPIGSPDFRGRTTAIKNTADQDLPIAYEKHGTSLSFTLDDSQGQSEIVLPLTWYKGYQVYQIVDGKQIPVTTNASANRMVSFQAVGAGSYICTYTRTPIQTASGWISGLSALGLLALYWRRKTVKHAKHKECSVA